MRGSGLLALALIATPVVADEVPTWAKVGDWTISIEPSLNNSCFAYAYFNGDTYLAMGYDRRDDTAYADFSDPDWVSLVEGQTYELTVRFGNKPEWTGDALVSRFTGGDMYLELIVDDAFLDEFAAQNSVRIGFGGREIANLGLQGSRRAMNEVIACQSKNSAAADPFAGEAVPDPFAGEPAPANDPFAQ